MAVQTIYRQQWATTFSRPGTFQQHTPAGSNYDPITGYPYPGLSNGIAIKVATPGTLDRDDSLSGEYSSAGVQFYGIGELDSERYLTSFSTYAWDQRAVICEVTYNFTTLDSATLYNVFTIAKGLISGGITFGLELDTDDMLWYVTYRTGQPAATSEITTNFDATGTYSVDDQDHVFRFEIQPGTITGDPLASDFSVASDGYWRIKIDGVLLQEVTGIALTFGYTDSDEYVRSPVHAQSVWLGLFGLIGPSKDLHLFREDVDSTSNLLTGIDHEVTGSYNVIAGDSGTVTGDRVALFNMKNGVPYSYTGNNAFIVQADEIILDGTVTGGGASELDDLSDVTITSPSDGQVLTYDGNGSPPGWVNSSLSAALDALGT